MRRFELTTSESTPFEATTTELAASEATESEAGASRSWYAGLAALLIIGYLVCQRTFAHIGVSPFYIGEISLVLFFVAAPSVILRMTVGSLMRRTPLSWFTWAAYVFLIYGVIQTIRGVMVGHDAMSAVQNLVFHIYPLFVFPGIWVGIKHPDFLRKIARPFAWCHGIYTLVFVFWASPAGLADVVGMEFGATPWFGQPVGSAVALLLLVCYEKNLLRVWIPLVLNLFAFMALQWRAEWLGFVVAVMLWAVLAGRVGQLVKVGVMVAALLMVGLIADFRFPSPGIRGGVHTTDISTRNLIARGIASFDERLATEISPDADFFAGTVGWRTEWWKAIARDVHDTTPRALFGPGHGYAMWDLHPVEFFDGKLRQPHNVFYFALGYTGWLGVVLFTFVQISLFFLLWRAFRLTGQPFGVCGLALGITVAYFSNYMETPYSAIPFYLMCGIAAGPVLRPFIGAQRLAPAERRLRADKEPSRP